MAEPLETHVRAVTGISARRYRDMLAQIGGERGLLLRLADPNAVLPIIRPTERKRLYAAYGLGLEATRARHTGMPINTSQDAAGVFAPRLRPLEHEQMWMLALDGGNRVIGLDMVAKGGLHGAALLAKDVMRAALRMGASAFILAHNHPSGNPRPSPEDLNLTKEVVRAGEAIGIPLVDHIIITPSGHTSMLDLELIPACT